MLSGGLDRHWYPAELMSLFDGDSGQMSVEFLREGQLEICDVESMDAYCSVAGQIICSRIPSPGAWLCATWTLHNGGRSWNHGFPECWDVGSWSLAMAKASKESPAEASRTI